MKKKIYLLFVFLSLLTVVKAQSNWTVGKEPVSEIISGMDHYYALQKSHSSNPDFFLSSNPRYLHPFFNTECIFSFIEVGEKKVNTENLKIFVLYNHEIGQYLMDGPNGYTKDKCRAFRFCMQQARLHDEISKLKKWEDYSSACSASDYPWAEEEGSWVLCSDKCRNFIGFGETSDHSGYSLVSPLNSFHNVWTIYGVEHHGSEAYDRLRKISQKYLGPYFYKDYLDEYYPVGTTPGCISAELRADLNDIYEVTDYLLNRSEVEQKPEVYNAMSDRIMALFERIQREVVPLSGYYLFRTSFNRSSPVALCDEKSSLGALGVPHYPTEQDGKFIWKVIPTAESGNFYLQNFGTGRFVGRSMGDTPFTMTTDSVFKVTLDPIAFGGLSYNLLADGMPMGSMGTDHVCETLYKFFETYKLIPVPQDTILPLLQNLPQTRACFRMHDLVQRVDRTLQARHWLSGLTMDGQFSPESTGLVNECEGSNSRYYDKESFFDASLSSNGLLAPFEGSHDQLWMQFNLGKPVKELYVKFSKPFDTYFFGDMGPVHYAFVGRTDQDQDQGEVWTDTLTHNTAVYSYSSVYPVLGRKDSATCIQKITFPHPVDKVRFVVTERLLLNKFGNYEQNAWAVSELRLYDVADCVEHPRHSLVPNGIRERLTTVLQQAKEALKNQNVTETIYEQLEQAAKDYWAYFDGPDLLEKKLASAERLLQDAKEGEELGTYPKVAVDDFRHLIDQVTTQMNEPALTGLQIHALIEQLDKGISTLRSRIISPQPGRIYRIVSTISHQGDDVHQLMGDCWSATLPYTNARLKMDGLYADGLNDRFNTLWLLEKSEKGFAFKSLYTGLYLDNVMDTSWGEQSDFYEYLHPDVRFSKTPHYFSLEPGESKGAFCIASGNGFYLRSGLTGMSHGLGSTFDKDEFVFHDATAEFASPIKITAQPDAVQILCVPFDLRKAYSRTRAAMKLLGIYQDRLQLTEYASHEMIPAGTPFVVITREQPQSVDEPHENFILAEMVHLYLYDNLDLNYEYQPVSQNGMVSAPYNTRLKKGYGILCRNQLVTAEEGDVVPAGTGYILPDLPQIDHPGTYSVAIASDFLDGAATGVPELQVSEPVDNAVYSLSGVKLIDHLDDKSDLQQLPRGIYLMGGRKIYVK